MGYSSGAEGLVILSGDAHFVAVVEHRSNQSDALCSIVEVASSPIAAVPLQPAKAYASYTGHEHGFHEEVKFLESGDHLYATVRLNASSASFHLWRFDDRTTQERLLVEAVVR